MGYLMMKFWAWLKALIEAGLAWGWPPKMKGLSPEWRMQFNTGRKTHLIADMHMHAREVDGGNAFYRY